MAFFKVRVRTLTDAAAAVFGRREAARGEVGFNESIMWRAELAWAPASENKARAAAPRLDQAPQLSMISTYGEESISTAPPFTKDEEAEKAALNTRLEGAGAGLPDSTDEASLQRPIGFFDILD